MLDGSPRKRDLTLFWRCDTFETCVTHMARVLLAAVALWFSLRAPRSPGGGTVTTWPARQDSPVEGPAWPGLVARIRGLVGNGLHCLGRLQLDIQWPKEKCNFWNSRAFDPIPARWPDLCAGRPLILTRKCCRQNSNLEQFIFVWRPYKSLACHAHQHQHLAHWRHYDDSSSRQRDCDLIFFTFLFILTIMGIFIKHAEHDIAQQKSSPWY